MKNIKLILSIVLLTAGIFTINTASAQSNAELDALAQKKYNEGVVAEAKVGSLICKDANGKFVVCSGSDYEKIQGFATSAPYVTINKPPMGEKPNEFSAIVSLQGGAIRKGDRLTVATGGTVKKCTELDIPYAIALTDASDDNALIKVKVINLK